MGPDVSARYPDGSGIPSPASTGKGRGPGTGGCGGGVREAYMRCGRRPGDSWWCPQSSRPRTGTSNPPAQTVPPPAVETPRSAPLAPAALGGGETRSGGRSEDTGHRTGHRDISSFLPPSPFGSSTKCLSFPTSSHLSASTLTPAATAAHREMAMAKTGHLSPSNPLSTCSQRVLLQIHNPVIPLVMSPVLLA